MEKETFFNSFLNGNTPLSGNFFGVTESCHLMTMSCTYLENRLLIHSYYNVHAMPTTHLAFLMNQVGTR